MGAIFFNPHPIKLLPFFLRLTGTGGWIGVLVEQGKDLNDKKEARATYLSMKPFGAD
ncbi:MAG: hypothetical protein MI923_21540 [Phycisphaerales bacterium]|nr:hypothetical protein [Phycisphaerales bacterium]